MLLGPRQWCAGTFSSRCFHLASDTRIGARILVIEPDEVDAIEVDHRTSRSSPMISVESVPPRSRLRSRRKARVQAGLAKNGCAGGGDAGTILAISCPPFVIHRAVAWWSSRMVIVFMCHIVTHRRPRSKLTLAGPSARLRSGATCQRGNIAPCPLPGIFPARPAQAPPLG